MAPPTPRWKGISSTVAPAALATSAVRSVEPPSTTSTSASGKAARASLTTWPTASSSLSAGMRMRTLRLGWLMGTSGGAAATCWRRQVSALPHPRPGHAAPWRPRAPARSLGRHEWVEPSGWRTSHEDVGAPCRGASWGARGGGGGRRGPVRPPGPLPLAHRLLGRGRGRRPVRLRAPPARGPRGGPAPGRAAGAPRGAGQVLRRAVLPQGAHARPPLLLRERRLLLRRRHLPLRHAAPPAPPPPGGGRLRLLLGGHPGHERAVLGLRGPLHVR